MSDQSETTEQYSPFEDSQCLVIRDPYIAHFLDAVRLGMRLMDVKRSLRDIPFLVDKERYRDFIFEVVMEYSGARLQ